MNQIFTDFEFLIIDDESSDETVSFLKLFIDSRIMLIEKLTNTGLTNILNTGFKLCTGELTIAINDVSI